MKCAAQGIACNNDLKGQGHEISISFKYLMSLQGCTYRIIIYSIVLDNDLQNID